MTPLMHMQRRERRIVFEGSKKNYPNVDLPKWMKKKGFEQEEEIEIQKF
jgi:hypothetical protein